MPVGDQKVYILGLLNAIVVEKTTREALEVLNMTQVKESEFKGHKIFGVFEEGKDKPVVSIGLKKAKAILAHTKELEDFVAKNLEPSMAAADKTPAIPKLF